jgi:hypothetical protein
MHSIGIDHQRTLSIICLREGPLPFAKRRSVGDGLRHIIPNIAQDEQLWGSQALTNQNVGSMWSKLFTESTWSTDDEARFFWRGLSKRLYTFLGQMTPTINNGFRTIVCLPATNYQVETEQVLSLCKQVDLSDTTIIPAIDTVLCRWLAERPLLQGRCTIVAVMVGDTSVDVRAYRLNTPGRPYPYFASASQIVSIEKTGLAWWADKLLSLIAERMDEGLPARLLLGLHDAAVEFGVYLSRAQPSQLISWTGPLQGRLFTPLQVTRNECASWTEVTSLTSRLPAIIRDVTQRVSDANRPDILLIGGIGALWPFPRDAMLETLGAENIWQSATPYEDGAWGAACWPEIGEPYQEVLELKYEILPPAPISQSILPFNTQRNRMSANIPADELPPWEQD